MNSESEDEVVPAEAPSEAPPPPPVPPPPPAPPPETCAKRNLMQNAVTIPGLQHIIDNLLTDVHTQLPFWDIFLRA